MSKNKKNTFNLTKTEISLLVLCTITFIILTLLIITNRITSFDALLFNLISSLKCSFLTNVFKFITFFCSIEFILIFTMLIIIVAKRNRKYFTFNVIICVILNQSLKYIFMRSRPVEINLISESGYSFPSGHSMMAVAFYGYFIYLILNSKLQKWKKILFSTLLISLILLIGISRIYLGVHYASDVLGGFCIAIVYLILFKLIERKKKF